MEHVDIVLHMNEPDYDSPGKVESLVVTHEICEFESRQHGKMVKFWCLKKISGIFKKVVNTH